MTTQSCSLKMPEAADALSITPAAVGQRISDVVAVVPIGLALEQRRSLAVTGTFDALTGSLVDGQQPLRGDE